jgi:hypothetical protein
MRIPRFRQRHEHGARGEFAQAVADVPATAASRPSARTRTGVGVDPTAPAATEGMTAAALAVERHWEAWREAATDAELAFGWWIGATVLDRKRAATGYFAAFEREEKAALAYQDAWKAWRSRCARDQAASAPAAS